MDGKLFAVDTLFPPADQTARVGQTRGLSPVANLALDSDSLIRRNDDESLHSSLRDMKPVYFDLTVKDVGAARRFFERVLGWRFEHFPLPYEYYRIQAGPPEEPGIDGGIGAVADAPICGGHPMVNLTMSVENLDQALEDVLAAGGAIVEAKTLIPGVGFYATCAEPGGLKFGLVEPDPRIR